MMIIMIMMIFYLSSDDNKNHDTHGDGDYMAVVNDEDDAVDFLLW